MAHGNLYLVVFENDKSSITWASTDQYKAQQMCHRIAKASGIPHAVVTAKRYDIPMSVILELKQFCKI